MSDDLATQLRVAGVKGVDTFVLKLVQNSGVATVARDIRSEGLAAWMFAAAGFSVEMSDSPDLLLSLDGCCLGAEVKHFRLKGQDQIDDARLRAAPATGFLVEYGDTMSSEGKAAWDQVVSVADAKAHQYRSDTPNILVIHSSSSHCIGDGEVRTAANILNERIVPGGAPPLLALNGLLLMSPEYNVAARRSVYFFELFHVRQKVASGVVEALRSIRKWVV